MAGKTFWYWGHSQLKWFSLHNLQGLGFLAVKWREVTVDMLEISVKFQWIWIRVFKMTVYCLTCNAYFPFIAIFDRSWNMSKWAIDIRHIMLFHVNKKFLWKSTKGQSMRWRGGQKVNPCIDPRYKSFPTNIEKFQRNYIYHCLDFLQKEIQNCKAFLSLHFEFYHLGTKHKSRCHFLIWNWTLLYSQFRPPSEINNYT